MIMDYYCQALLILQSLSLFGLSVDNFWQHLATYFQ